MFCTDLNSIFPYTCVNLAINYCVDKNNEGFVAEDGHIQIILKVFGPSQVKKWKRKCCQTRKFRLPVNRVWVQRKIF